MNTNPTSAARKPNDGIPDLKFVQDERGYVGVELSRINPKYRRQNRPVRLALFANNYGTFEATFDLTLDEAEGMREWLDAVIAVERRVR